jgi:hypothetical protein
MRYLCLICIYIRTDCAGLCFDRAIREARPRLTARSYHHHCAARLPPRAGAHDTGETTVVRRT